MEERCAEIRTQLGLRQKNQSSPREAAANANRTTRVAATHRPSIALNSQWT